MKGQNGKLSLVWVWGIFFFGFVFCCLISYCFLILPAQFLFVYKYSVFKTLAWGSVPWILLILVRVLIRGKIEELIFPRERGLKLFCLFRGSHFVSNSPFLPIPQVSHLPLFLGRDGWHWSKTLWVGFGYVGTFLCVPLAPGPSWP